MADLPPPRPYRGRFAPSPTGPLHFGSLIAATGSYLQAKTRQGEWQLRIDDIDPPREIAGASDAILSTLEAFGFEWDGPVSFQSQRSNIYRDALATLQHKGVIYPCACTRKRIAEAQPPSSSHIYPGTCRHGLNDGQQARMLRINTEGAVIEFDDLVQGHCRYDLETDIGDYVLLRADGLFAYQLATGIDDAEQGITEVVRGSDLLDSTPCQILIQQGLGLDTPEYCHLPVVLSDSGQKLSKQNKANSLVSSQANELLWLSLVFLGHLPPLELRAAQTVELWQWAIENWQIAKVPKQKTIPVSDIAQAREQNYSL